MHRLGSFLRSAHARGLMLLVLLLATPARAATPGGTTLSNAHLSDAWTGSISGAWARALPSATFCS